MAAEGPKEAPEEAAPAVPAGAAEAAVQRYCRRFAEAEARDGGALSFQRKDLDWSDEESTSEGESSDSEEPPAAPGLRAALERDLRSEPRAGAAAPPQQEAAPCCPGRERLLLCRQCRLPLGDAAYEDCDPERSLTHGECMAQLVLRDLQEEQREKERSDAEEKRARRKEYDIGWRAELVPRNAVPVQRLRNGAPVQGMCCLVLDEAARTVRVAATAEPAAAVNLEYLSIALKVRAREGREPLFSLDPVGPQGDHRKAMQEKRFEPTWLAGTSVGEVLFQSDYHLKELSMGEYEQPIVGMKSCFDYSDEERDGKDWSAREWYVVRRAEVQKSQDDVLIPFLKMAVEAREQVMGKHGLEDVRTTRPNHPLVKYAEAFTHNFDLIAERKSVVFHLRELAKASILAKLLIEADVRLDEAWYDLAGEPDEMCCMELPQLWNDRVRSQIRVEDGKILNADTGFGSCSHSLYGGVQFGLHRFQLAGGRGPARALSAGLPATRVSAGLAARQFVQPSRHLSAGLATRSFQRSFGPVGVHQASVSAGGPRGVDLNLDRFSLSGTTGFWAGDVQASEACADISKAFWPSIDQAAGSPFEEEDRLLLRSVFNPHLSDRREEEDLFAPPDTSFAYVQKLRSLVKEEEAVRQRRKEHFCSPAFSPEDPGGLFPFSWKKTLEIARGEAKASHSLRPRPDYKAQARMFEHVLKSAVPAFDKSTEDGLRFRVYRFGSLEVRTTQEHGGEELVGAVFARAEGGAGRPKAAEPEEKVVKVTEYVEMLDAQANERHSYVVLGTEAGGSVLTEKLPDGTVRWEEAPKDLEDRNSLAKVVRSADVAAPCATVGSVRARWVLEAATSLGYRASRAARESYAQRIYCLVHGERASSGFRER